MKKKLKNRVGIFKNIFFKNISEKNILKNFFKIYSRWEFSEGLRPATLLKKRLWHRCFPVKFWTFLRTPFLQSTSGRLLLLMVPLINRKALYRNDSYFWWKTKLYVWSCIIISPWSRWGITNNLEVLVKTFRNFCNRATLSLTRLQDRRKRLKK